MGCYCMDTQPHFKPGFVCEIRRCGPPTHLGRITVSQLEANLWEETDCLVCHTCRRALLCSEKLTADYDVLNGNLKAKVCRDFWQALLHFQSPSAIGASPAVKQRAPLRSPHEQLLPTEESIMSLLWLRKRLIHFLIVPTSMNNDCQLSLMLVQRRTLPSMQEPTEKLPSRLWRYAQLLTQHMYVVTVQYIRRCVHIRTYHMSSSSPSLYFRTWDAASAKWQLLIQVLIHAYTYMHARTRTHTHAHTHTHTHTHIVTHCAINDVITVLEWRSLMCT